MKTIYLKILRIFEQNVGRKIYRMAASHFNTMDSLREHLDKIHVHWNVSYIVLVHGSTYLTEGKVILVATPGEKRSEDKTVGEACTSLLSGSNMACCAISIRSSIMTVKTKKKIQLR